ncbi:hypothetical protein L1987_79804 [Smallanthus sonchifolius]|uniref:Uncharacterized protein n=1 Tax=Smallanthus sonchifolius TaxID=185202 RepID=A0ACB8YLK2_9ASTR|nr:hypothetical protein L1987_79804 [Smallanthus sonchifolius]
MCRRHQRLDFVTNHLTLQSFGAIFSHVIAPAEKKIFRLGFTLSIHLSHRIIQSDFQATAQVSVTTAIFELKTMDKSDESPNEQFNLNNFPEEQKVDHVDDNFLESSHINEELGFKNVKRESSDAVHDVTHIMEQNPNVNRDQRNRPGRSDHADQIGNTGHIGSSSHETMPYQRNVLDQGIDGNRPVFHSASLSLGTRSHLRNALGHGTGRTRPVSHSPSLSLRRRSHLRNVLGHGTGGTRHVSHSASSSLGQDIVGTRLVLPPSVVVMRTMSYITYPATATPRPRPPHNQILDDPIEVLRNMNLPPYVNSSFFIPRGVHVHNMRIRSSPDMVGRYVFRQGPPVVQMVPPMVEMRPPIVMRPPRVELPPPMVQMVPPMVEMRPPTVQMGGHRGFLHDPMPPSSNINMAGQSDGRIGEAGYGDEATSRDRSQRNDKQELTSRNAKRSKSCPEIGSKLEYAKKLDERWPDS